MGVPAAVTAAMQEINDRFCREAIGQGKIEAFEQIYTRGARVLPPGSPMVEGIDAVKEFWQQAIAGLGLTGATLSTIEIEMCGDSAVEIGHAELNVQGGATILGKYIVHWKQEDGAWRWDKDIWNAH